MIRLSPSTESVTVAAPDKQSMRESLTVDGEVPRIHESLVVEIGPSVKQRLRPADDGARLVVAAEEVLSALTGLTKIHTCSSRWVWRTRPRK